VTWFAVWFEPLTHVKWVVIHPASIQANSWRALCRKPFLERYQKEIASVMWFLLSARVIRNSRHLWFWNVHFCVHKQRSSMPCFVALESMHLNSNVLCLLQLCVGDPNFIFPQNFRKIAPVYICQVCLLFRKSVETSSDKNGHKCVRNFPRFNRDAGNRRSC
jgi:hypothetical protein